MEIYYWNQKKMWLMYLVALTWTHLEASTVVWPHDTGGGRGSGSSISRSSSRGVQTVRPGPGVPQTFQWGARITPRNTNYKSPLDIGRPVNNKDHLMRKVNLAKTHRTAMLRQRQQENAFSSPNKRKIENPARKNNNLLGKVNSTKSARTVPLRQRAQGKSFRSVSKSVEMIKNDERKRWRPRNRQQVMARSFGRQLSHRMNKNRQDNNNLRSLDLKEPQNNRQSQNSRLLRRKLNIETKIMKKSNVSKEEASERAHIPNVPELKQSNESVQQSSNHTERKLQIGNPDILKQLYSLSQLADINTSNDFEASLNDLNRIQRHNKVEEGKQFSNLQEENDNHLKTSEWDVDHSKTQLLEDFRDGPHADGSYHFRYRTSDGTFREEQGVPSDNAVGSLVVIGTYSYKSPNGEVVAVDYIADENGYRAFPSTDRSRSDIVTPLAPVAHSTAPGSGVILYSVNRGSTVTLNSEKDNTSSNEVPLTMNTFDHRQAKKIEAPKAIDQERNVDILVVLDEDLAQQSTLDAIRTNISRNPNVPIQNRNQIRPAQSINHKRPIQIRNQIRPTQTRNIINPTPNRISVSPLENSTPRNPTSNRNPIRPTPNRHPIRPISNRRPINPTPNRNPIRTTQNEDFERQLNNIPNKVNFDSLAVLRQVATNFGDRIHETAPSESQQQRKTKTRNFNLPENTNSIPVTGTNKYDPVTLVRALTTANVNHQNNYNVAQPGTRVVNRNGNTDNSEPEEIIDLLVDNADDTESQIININGPAIRDRPPETMNDENDNSRSSEWLRTISKFNFPRKENEDGTNNIQSVKHKGKVKLSNMGYLPPRLNEMEIMKIKPQIVDTLTEITISTPLSSLPQIVDTLTETTTSMPLSSLPQIVNTFSDTTTSTPIISLSTTPFSISNNIKFETDLSINNGFPIINADIKDQFEDDNLDNIGASLSAILALDPPIRKLSKRTTPNTSLVNFEKSAKMIEQSPIVLDMETIKKTLKNLRTQDGAGTVDVETVVTVNSQNNVNLIDPVSGNGNFEILVEIKISCCNDAQIKIKEVRRK